MVDSWADIDPWTGSLAEGPLELYPLGRSTHGGLHGLAPFAMGVPLGTTAILDLGTALGAGQQPFAGGPEHYAAIYDVFAPAEAAADAAGTAAAETLWSPGEAAAGSRGAAARDGALLTERSALDPLNWEAEVASIRSRFYGAA